MEQLTVRTLASATDAEVLADLDSVWLTTPSHLGTWPPDTNATALRDRALWLRDESGGALKLAGNVRYELVGVAGGYPDLTNYCPWWTMTTTDEEWATRSTPWVQAGYKFGFNATALYRELWSGVVSPAVGYWIINRAPRLRLLLQAAVANVADPFYRAWAKEHIQRWAAWTEATPLVGWKAAWWGWPTQTLHTPEGIVDLRNGALIAPPRDSKAPLVTTPWDGEVEYEDQWHVGMRAMAREVGLPFYTEFAARTPHTGNITKAEFEWSLHLSLAGVKDLWQGET